MANSAEFFAAIEKVPGVKHTGLWLNEKGFRRASAVKNVDLKGVLPFSTLQMRLPCRIMAAMPMRCANVRTTGYVLR